MVYGLNHKPINPWFQFFFWPKSGPSLTLPTLFFLLYFSGTLCKSYMYDPLEGNDEFHDGDAEEDANGSTKLGDQTVQLAHQILFPV